jgi:tetratricopeptide (TPR) repeat protein
VLVVCTETYYRRFRGHEVPGKGKGVDWEGALITQELYDARSHTLKFVPVLFSADAAEFIPEPLRAVNYYTPTSQAGYQSLYDSLLAQSGVEPGKVGTQKTKPRRKGMPLTFGEASPSTEGCCDISRILKYAPAQLIGREEETELLNEAWTKVTREEKGRPHVLTIVALGGEGKTALVAKWAAELAAQDWPGCDAAFAWSFYSQGTREQQAASSDLFLKQALTFFGDDADKAFAASPAGAFEKGQRLARLVGQRRSLLVLDGLEPLQYAPTAPTPGELKDQGLAALLKGLAAASHGLCIVTTRYSLPDLKAFWQTTAPEKPLLRLSREAGVHLLQQLGVRKESGTKQEFEKLVEDVQGHALTLTLLGSYLRDVHEGDIRKRDLVRLEEADAEEQGGHAFHVMAAYERAFEREGDKGRRALAILRLLGLFDRPMTADCFGALLQPPAISDLTDPLIGITEAQRNIAIKRLEDAKLVTVNRAETLPSSFILPTSIDAHPLLREYFSRQLRAQHPDAWRAAHRRLYEHLCASTKEGDQPTLEDLQPLYQAVAHGCQAGLQREAREKVYKARIDRGNEFYSTSKLGAFGSDLGAVACFFEQPWSRVSPALSEDAQARTLNAAAFRLRALGRLTEALEPTRAGLPIEIKQKDWSNAAIRASNLSELELTLGEVAGAVGDAEQSVTYADRSGDAFLRCVMRVTDADALHQAGRRAEAETRFREAEQMQKERQPAYPLLYSLQGFEYCDLLLAAPERAAWQTILGLETENLALETLAAVSQRAAQTLDWWTTKFVNASLLDFALHHLTLGRAALYEAILAKSEIQNPKSEIEQAVAGLRRAGTTHHIPRALLTRAWLRYLEGCRTGAESAQADLDEAWEIAERGPMRLFLADIHLYRARLFFREEEYPWESPAADLAEARKLIEQCGYGRRKEELEDAEAGLRR